MNLALNMRSCWIETGTAVMRSNDAIAQDNTKCLKVLSPEQQNIIRSNDSLVAMIRQKSMSL